MKRFLSIIFTSFIISIGFLGNFSFANSVPSNENFYISRIKSGGDKFVEIYNNSADTQVDSLKILSGVRKTNILTRENFTFEADSYLVFRAEDLGAAKISEKAIIFVQINGVEEAYFDASTDSRNSTDLKKGVAVFKGEFLKEHRAFSGSKGKYTYELVDEKDNFSKPVNALGSNSDASSDEEDTENNETSEKSEDDKKEDGIESGENSSNSSNLSKSGESKDSGVDSSKDDLNDESGEDSTNIDDDSNDDQNDRLDSKDNSGENKDENSEEAQTPQIRITEIFANGADQFIEIQNFSNEDIDLSRIIISGTAKGSKDFVLPVKILSPGEIFVVKITETDLKLNKTTAGEVSLKTKSGEKFEVVSFEKLATNSSWAFFENENYWRQTFKVTPGEENIFEEFASCVSGQIRNSESGKCIKIQAQKTKISLLKTCEDGYVLNKKTNRCNKIAVKTSTQTPCAAGYYRNVETGRCRKKSTASVTLTPCKEGYYRSKETNRCRKIEDDSKELTPCKDGWERNPETNRCRKNIKNDGASDEVEEVEAGPKNEFAGWWAIFVIILLVVAILIWEFRKSLFGFLKKNKRKNG